MSTGGFEQAELSPCTAPMAAARTDGRRGGVRALRTFGMLYKATAETETPDRADIPTSSKSCMVAVDFHFKYSDSVHTSQSNLNHNHDYNTQSNPLNGSPDNGSIRVLVPALESPILVISLLN